MSPYLISISIALIITLLYLMVTSFIISFTMFITYHSNSVVANSVLQLDPTGPEIIKIIELTITNNELNDISIDSITFSNPVFKLGASVLPLVITPGSSASLFLEFNSDNLGIFTSEVSIITNSNTFIFSLNIEVLPSSIEISYQGLSIANEHQINIGTTPVSTPINLIFTISNTGTGDLLVHLPRVTAGFSITTFPQTVIPPGTSSNLEVVFNAYCPGEVDAYLCFNTNDSSNYSLRYKLLGIVTSINSITVISTADTGPGSLRQAVLDATAGTIIYFDASLANQTITLLSQIHFPTKPITVDGSQAPGLILSGNGTNRVFSFQGERHYYLKSLTLTDGFTEGTGNIGSGGVITCSTTKVSLTLDNCTVSNGICNGNGGAGIWMPSSSILTCKYSTFFNNDASACTGERGGGAVAIAGLSVAYLRECIFDSNKGVNGGAYNCPSTLAIVEECTFINNDTRLASTLTQTASSPRGFGGAIYSDGVSVSNGIHTSGTMYYIGNKFLNNKGASRAGAVFLFLNVKDRGIVKNCIFNNNLVIPATYTGNVVQGGALRLNDKPTLISNCSFINNRSYQEGGGLWCGRDTTKEIVLVNCIFSGNIAKSGNGSLGFGGGASIYNKAHLLNCTFINNKAVSHSAALATNAQAPHTPIIKLTNNIFSNNFLVNSTSPNNQCNFLHVAEGPNVQYPAPTSNLLVSNPITVDPLLESLIKISGFPIHISQVDSPVIDAGITTQYNYDIVGTPRPLDGNLDTLYAFDLGAVERLPAVSFTVKRGNLDQLSNWTF